MTEVIVSEVIAITMCVSLAYTIIAGLIFSLDQPTTTFGWIMAGLWCGALVLTILSFSVFLMYAIYHLIIWMLLHGVPWE